MLPGALPKTAQPMRANGGGPPKDANASELWVKFTQLPRPLSEPHVFRAKGQEVGTLVFRVLSAGELSSVIVDAHKATVEKLGEEAKGSVAFEELYLEQKAIHLTVLACRQPEDDGKFPVFMNARDVRENLTDDEIAVLQAAYGIFRRESGPILSEITPEEAEAWYELLAKGASRSPLGRCSGEALTDLVMYLVSRLKAVSSIATSSHGLRPEERSIQTLIESRESASPDTAST